MAERMSMDTVLAAKWTNIKYIAGFESGEDLALSLDDPDVIQKAYNKIIELNQPNRKNYELVDLIWFTKSAWNVAATYNLFKNDKEHKRIATSIDEGRELTTQKYIAKIQNEAPFLVGASKCRSALLRSVQRIPGMTNVLNAHAFDPERRRINQNLARLERVFARACRV